MTTRRARLLAGLLLLLLFAAPRAALGVAPTPTLPTAGTAPTVLPAASPAPTTAAANEPPVPPLRERFTPRDGDRVTYVAPGVIHVARTVEEEPWRINVLLFDTTATQFDLKAALGDDWLSGRTQTSYLVAKNGALAGVNGDLFNNNGVPQGLTLSDSKVAVAPKHRATFAWSKERKPLIGYFTQQWTWQAEAEAADGERFPIQLLNWSCEYGVLCLYNRFAQVVPAGIDDVKVLVGPRGSVLDVIEAAAVNVPTGTQVLVGTGKAATWLLEHMAVDTPVTITTTTDPPLDQFSQGISGGPIILRDGGFIQDCLCTLGDCSVAQERGPLEVGDVGVDNLFSGPVCEDFDFDWKLGHYFWKLMPRTGIAYDKAQQTLIVAQVDGYQAGYSRGMTQKEFADLLREFGADTAMELDGGGSSTMVIENRVVNQPSDQTGERFVANGLLFFWTPITGLPQARAPARAE